MAGVGPGDGKLSGTFHFFLTSFLCSEIPCPGIGRPSPLSGIKGETCALWVLTQVWVDVATSPTACPVSCHRPSSPLAMYGRVSSNDQLPKFLALWLGLELAVWIMSPEGMACFPRAQRITDISVSLHRGQVCPRMNPVKLGCTGLACEDFGLLWGRPCHCCV